MDAIKTASRPEANRERLSALKEYLIEYVPTHRIKQTILTPVHLVSFLLSLYLVDCYYRGKRIQEHSKRYSRLPSWVLPSWLDRILFSPQPYGWVDRKKRDGPNAGPNHERWYYHTQQHKLMKMEAVDALELQRNILLGLCVVIVLFSLWLFWRLSTILWTSTAC
ncbi:hypothetical protein F5B19DRAFT_325660 [Rostrohypoxylon terebratum]|nr:hypothetical protein F5B19DRAFT_325660 [Rostrohypoxylon terebratum]